MDCRSVGRSVGLFFFGVVVGVVVGVVFLFPAANAAGKTDFMGRGGQPLEYQTGGTRLEMAGKGQQTGLRFIDYSYLQTPFHYYRPKDYKNSNKASDLPRQERAQRGPSPSPSP